MAKNFPVLADMFWIYAPIVDVSFDKARIIYFHQARQLELNFTVGEALSCIGAGNQSLAAKDKWLLDSKSLQITSKEHSMKSILDTIFSRFVNSTANFDKQVWLSLTHVMLLIY